MVDWPGLLKWTMTHTDGTKFNTDLKPLDPETRKWLEEALDEYTFSEVKRMMAILDKLEKPENPEDPNDEPERVNLLDELWTHLDGLESARDLVKMKRFHVLIDVMLKSQYPEARKIAYMIFSGANANNLLVQNASMELSGFQVLNSVIKEEKMDVKEGAMSALTSLIRGENLENKRRFIDIDGIEFLLEILNNDKDYNSVKIKTKAMTALNDFMYYDDKIMFYDMIQYNSSQGTKIIPDQQVGFSHLKKEPKEEEPKKKEIYNQYKNIVHSKLIAKNFIFQIEKFLDKNMLKQYQDLRPALFSIIVSLIQSDPSLKLSNELKGKLKSFSEFLKAESQKSENLYESELNVIDNLLML